MTLQLVDFLPRLPPDGGGPGIPIAPCSVPTAVAAATAENCKRGLLINYATTKMYALVS